MPLALVATLAISCSQEPADDSSTKAPLDPTPAANAAPIAAASVKGEPVAGFPFKLDGSASADSDGTVGAWHWDLGNGTVLDGKTAEAKYASAGTYTIKLTVTDDDGATGATTVDVTVKKAGTVTVGVE